MTLTIQDCQSILAQHDLLKTQIIKDNTTVIENIAYDSRKVTAQSLFFCKGNFKPDYLTTAIAQGAKVYVSQQPLQEGQTIDALIVKDVQKAMAILSAAFYGWPQNELFIIGLTGTKGKTTTAYFTHAIMQRYTKQKTALFSTIDRVLGSKPQDKFKSDLTTPESLDLFHDMRKAVDNGMTHLVMEVSSQAYKKNRVYGLKFDIGYFLNISPDHIGENEHPTFADYLQCKLQLLANSKQCVISTDTNCFDEVIAAATATHDRQDIWLFGQNQQPNENDFYFKNSKMTLANSEFEIQGLSKKAQALQIDGCYQLQLIGDFNESNATAAIIAARLAGANQADCQSGVASLQVPGRMESLTVKGHGQVYVDYAHNYASMKALLAFLKTEYQQPKIIVVVGSPGNKGISRRAGFAKVLNEFAQQAILTTDDPAFEEPLAIAQEIAQAIDPTKVSYSIELDRPLAIKQAILASQPGDIVVLAAKGDDHYQKIRGVDTPYIGDMAVAKSVAANIE